jgi:hypothetical protein
VDVVYIGADRGEGKVHGVSIQENFARALSREEAMNSGALLTY